SVEAPQLRGAATLHEVLTPPSGTTTHVPDGLRLTIADGRAEVTGATLDDAALAQIVYSLTTFPTVRSVNGNTRADVEKLVPPILVEHPSPGESVTSPVNVSGTANTYVGLGDARDVRRQQAVHRGHGSGRDALRLRGLRRGRIRHPQARDSAPPRALKRRWPVRPRPRDSPSDAPVANMSQGQSLGHVRRPDVCERRLFRVRAWPTR